MVFRQGLNSNHVRVRDEDLPGLAASFVGAPFLRNHDERDIGSREGTVLASVIEDGAMRQRLRVTTARGLQALAEGQIDRFSIAFDVRRWDCSVCGGDWLRCDHFPGREYVINGQRRVCELIAVDPVGREVSAVNVPAVSGTGMLAALCDWKDEFLKEGFEVDKVDGVDGTVETVVADSSVALAALNAELAAARQARLALEAERREAAIRASGLSEHGQTVVRLATLHGGDVAGLIEAQRAAEAALSGVVRGNRSTEITGMRSAEDRAQDIMDWMVGLSSAPMPAPNMRGVRDLYLAMTGDYEFHGKFIPTQAQFANATTSNLPGLAANALNKVILQYYESMATWRWYEPLVSVLPHDGTTQDIQMIMVDGVANLSSVSEGAAYTELSVGDSKESLAFSKKGNYVGITLEMFRRSEIGKMQAIPRAMAMASLRTRSAAIAAIFTANSGAGPTLADDSTALFHSNHGNLATVAFSSGEWAAARKRIWSQTVPGTSKKFGMWPTFVLVPIDLYDTALETFGFGTGDVGKPNGAGTAQTPNPYGGSRPGDPRPIPVAVPDWSDATDWAYMVDPRLHAVIHMAYASAPQGNVHAMPEFFAATQENNGLMFTNDTLAVKVRDWWGYGVSGYVGIGKNNVA